VGLSHSTWMFLLPWHDTERGHIVVFHWGEGKKESSLTIEIMLHIC